MENSQNNIEENDIMYIYEWVDSVNLSKPKKNIARDFSDGGISMYNISLTRGNDKISYT